MSIGGGMSRGLGFTQGWVCPGDGYHPPTWNRGYHGIWSECEWYASYWNAFWFYLIFFPGLRLKNENMTADTQHAK